jgi:hypothetical protein
MNQRGERVFKICGGSREFLRRGLRSAEEKKKRCGELLARADELMSGQKIGRADEPKDGLRSGRYFILRPL